VLQPAASNAANVIADIRNAFLMGIPLLGCACWVNLCQLAVISLAVTSENETIGP